MPLPTDPAEQLEIGRHAHEKTYGTVRETALHFGVADHQIYPLQAQYRAAHGIVSEASERVRASQEQRLASRVANRAANTDAAAAKKERARIRHKAARDAKRQAKRQAKLNGNGQHLVPVADVVAKARIADLEHQLSDAMEEIHALQKILMTVGKAL